MLPTLLHHLIWADLRTASALDSIAEPPAELLRTWGHLLAAGATWLARLAGREPEVPIWPTLDREACRALMVRNHTPSRRAVGLSQERAALGSKSASEAIRGGHPR